MALYKYVYDMIGYDNVQGSSKHPATATTPRQKCFQ